MTLTDAITIRPFVSADADRLVAINAAAVPATNLITRSELEELVASSLVCLVAELNGIPTGFLLCLGEGLGYESANYRWLSEHHDRFAYIDRICVDEAARGNRVGEKLYLALFQKLAGTDRPFVCEVNKRPPNPGSLRFHERLGFAQIGEEDHGEKAVIFMERRAEGTP